MSEGLSLWALFASAFTSATILPGTSELGLLAFVRAFPNALWAALALATVGNTLGGLTSYVLGRFVPSAQIRLQSAPKVEKVQILLKRYGASILLLSWVPVIGDLLCVAAGWLRLNVWACVLAMAVGKLARYAVVVGAFTVWR